MSALDQRSSFCKQFLFRMFYICATSPRIRTLSKNGLVTLTSVCRHHIWKSIVHRSATEDRAAHVRLIICLPFLPPPISDVSFLLYLDSVQQLFYNSTFWNGLLQPHTSLITLLCHLKAVKLLNTVAFQSFTKHIPFQ